ncbi:RnfH family protein [Variovorax sp. RHLX14]|uniref:RnfH family protein n=1 Tax=Variovorax sp. RHLX14 TaxID=1259731 RepID=UPI003F450775
MSVEVTLVYSPAPREMFEQVLVLGSGATAKDAVAASRIRVEYPGLDWQAMTPGIWGNASDWDRLLLGGERIELCRPLLVDPKVARRERFQKQGTRGTGLFARQREGGKSGY